MPQAYGHPEILVDVPWVAAHVHDDGVRIVDTRIALEASLYPAGHLPGAVYADVFQDVCCPSKIETADDFARAMGRLGVGDATTVVIYDTSGGLWAARLWWALRYFGHEQVRILDGGLRAWVAAGQPVETVTPSVTPTTFHPKIQASWRAAIDEVRAAIVSPDVALVDALSWPSFTGDLVDNPRPGHIPSSVSLSVSDLTDGIGQSIQPPDVLARMLNRLGLDPRQRTITYCGGGYAGADAAFVLYLMGFSSVGLYDGALGEWAADPSNPMETVP